VEEGKKRRKKKKDKIIIIIIIIRNKHLIEDVLTQRREEDLSTPVEVCDQRENKEEAKEKFTIKQPIYSVMNTLNVVFVTQ
jgi:formyltetrahydrofolate hydrolase